MAGLAEERRLLVAGDPGDRAPRRRTPRSCRRPAAEGSGSGSEPGSTPSSSQSSSSQAQLADVEQHRPRGVRVVGHVAAGELEDEPGVDRAERRRRRAPSTFCEQPLDLRAGEVGVDHEPGPLADQRLVARLAQLVAARRGAPVLPDERVVDRLAGRRVPGDDRLALVGDPDRRRGPRPSMPASASASTRDPARHLPDLGGVVLDPARPREVLRELASRRGRAIRPSPSKTRQVVPSFPGRSRGSSAGNAIRRAPVPPRAKSRSWRPRWRKPASVRPVARCARSSSISADAEAGADRVDRHRRSPSRSRRRTGAARADVELASPAGRRSAPSRSSPQRARIAQRAKPSAMPKPPPTRLAKRRDREVALAGLDRLDQRRPARAARRAEVPSQSSDGRPRSPNSPSAASAAARHVAALAVRAAAG